ncbi:MAG: c-type cytochrome, partial [Burkholderiales bacterium]|nr:c-type cytochrome [Burkholderiales bacterium]
AGAAAAEDAAAPPSAYAARYASQCAACHGERGHSADSLVPHLGGQPAFYTITQLFLFREGRRNDHPMAAAMTAAASAMSDADLRGFSSHVATLPPPPAPADARDAGRAARGRALADRHRCTACHGAELAGGEQVPRLARQHEDYLLLALRGFKAGVRLGYSRAMSDVLVGLSDADLVDLAHHLAMPDP